jgi:error-prone DNA polymerase
VRYAELQTTTNFSFLRGGSHAEELVEEAARLGHSAIGIADRHTLAGVVRAHVAAKKTGLRLAIGARLDTKDGYTLLVYPMDLVAYSRLTRLLTIGNRRAAKGQCDLSFDDLAEYAVGLLAIVLPPRRPDDPAFGERLRGLARLYSGRCYLAATALFRGDDTRRLAQLDHLAARAGAPLVATNDVHYHAPHRRALHDVLTAIRLGCTVDELGFRRFANAERHLKPPEEMARLFRRHPRAIDRTVEIVERCNFSLDELKYEYPVEHEAGELPQDKLSRLAWEGAAWRYPDGVPDKVSAAVKHELALVAELKYAPYFLTVHEIVHQARTLGILCQGRGSAANSAVCYCIGITAVDPIKADLLFERFISSSRNEPPDIDVDFEHERREEIIQWIYGRYGRERAGLAATVISYRNRSAIRDVGKAMGLSSDVLGALAGTVWGAGSDGLEPHQIREAGIDPGDGRVSLALELADTLTGFPRHLSQHVGGFIITAGRLDELVPIQNAAMADRTVIEWDKSDLDALGILKIDVLALGMLTCIRKAFDLIGEHYGRAYTLATVPQDDQAVYDMLCRADSLGVFQVESRAQMTMLPRLKPRTYYDLVIEVAIVRPGPIQGDMVHPYLRRRDGLEPIDYPPGLEAALGRTLGVPLFQEQAMKIAILAAGFSAAEADLLRRAMATFRHAGKVSAFRDKFIKGMLAHDYSQDFAERCFHQIEGFGEYGFPESHAASFALLVYVSSWIKCHYPDVFAAALLNAQPMGFYAPAQIVRDAREHRVEVRPPDVNASTWDNTLEPQAPLHALRLGFRQIGSFPEKEARRLVDGRATPYRDVADLWRRSGLAKRHIETLARADAFASLGLSRRDVLWATRGFSDAPLPLFDARPGAEENEPGVSLARLTLGEQVVDDYRAIAMSLKAHPMSLIRPTLDGRRVARNDALATARNGSRITVAGLVLVRQRPGTASGVVFVTIEDESGIANLVVWPGVFEDNRRTVMGARLLAVRGRVQREGLVIHVVAEELRDWSGLLDGIADADPLQPPLARADERFSGPGGSWVAVPEARATHVRATAPGIKIASRDFH